MNPSDTQTSNNEPIRVTWAPDSWISTFAQSKKDSQSIAWDRTQFTTSMSTSSQIPTLSLNDFLSSAFGKNSDTKNDPVNITANSPNTIHVKNPFSFSENALIDTEDTPSGITVSQSTGLENRAANTNIEQITINFASLLDLGYGDCNKHKAIEVNISLTDLILGEQSKVTQKLLETLSNGKTSSSSPFIYNEPDTQDPYFGLNSSLKNMPSFLQPSLLDEPILEDLAAFGAVKAIYPTSSSKPNLAIHNSDTFANNSKLNPKASEFTFSLGANQSDADETLSNQSDTYSASGSPFGNETNIYNVDSSKLSMENLTSLSRASRSDTEPRGSSVGASESDYAGLEASTNTNDSMWNPHSLTANTSQVSSDTQDLFAEIPVYVSTTKFNTNASEFKVDAPRFDTNDPESNTKAPEFNINVPEFKPAKDEFFFTTTLKPEAPEFKPIKKEIVWAQVNDEGTKVQVDVSKFRVDAPEFNVEATEFKIDGTKFNVEATEFKITAPEFNVEATEFKVDAPEFKVDAPEFKVDAPEFKVEAPEFNVGAPEFNVGATEFNVGAPEFNFGATEFNVEATEFKLDAPEFKPNDTEFKLDAPEFTIDTTRFSIDNIEPNVHPKGSDKTAKEYNVNGSKLDTNAPEFNVYGFGLNVDITPFNPLNTTVGQFSGPGIYSPTAKDPYDFSPEEYYDPSYLTNSTKNINNQTQSSLTTPEFSPSTTSRKINLSTSLTWN
ncbi:hypothetical protein CLU79DRAFT_889249 [Phycomyces nitens]|nr:hypothetical protein CLU79DRAFT_889249 [Phycomyces nitens]